MGDAFIHGLHDPFVRALLQREDFSTLRHALEAAERTVSPDKRVRSAHVDQPVDSTLSVLLAKMESLEHQLRLHSARDDGAKSRKTAEDQTASSARVCYNCGIKGHIKAVCRQRPKEFITCTRCNQKGHYNRLCRAPASSAPQSASVASVSTPPAPPQPFLFQLLSHSAPEVKPSAKTETESGNA